MLVAQFDVFAALMEFLYTDQVAALAARDLTAGKSFCMPADRKTPVVHFISTLLRVFLDATRFCARAAWFSRSVPGY